MKFQSKSQKEIDEEKLLPDGEYGIVVSGAKEGVSSAGNDMITLTVRVYRPDGKFNLVTDYLTEAMLYKILHFCEATGLTDKYNAGTLEEADIIGKECFAKIKTQPAKGDYQAKNVIQDYIVPKVGEDKTFTAPKDNLNKALDGDELEDSIPF